MVKFQYFVHWFLTIAMHGVWLVLHHFCAISAIVVRFVHTIWFDFDMNTLLYNGP